MDWANIERYDFDLGPEYQDVITTWHKDDTIEELFYFAKHSAKHPAVRLGEVIIFDVRDKPRQSVITDTFIRASINDVS